MYKTLRYPLRQVAVGQQWRIDLTDVARREKFSSWFNVKSDIKRVMCIFNRGRFHNSQKPYGVGISRFIREVPSIHAVEQ